MKGIYRCCVLSYGVVFIDVGAFRSNGCRALISILMGQKNYFAPVDKKNSSIYLQPIIFYIIPLFSQA